jgi:hypothetical protein
MSLRLIDIRKTKIRASRAQLLVTDSLNRISGNQSFSARKPDALWINLLHPSWKYR